jgi:hypothetical protein
MTLRMLALVLAAVLAVPAVLLLLRSPLGDGSRRPSWLSLDGLWTVVPVVLLVALFAFAAAA